MDIKDRTIKGRDIKNDVLGSNKVRNGSLKASDFKARAAARRRAQGPAGVGRWALVDATGAIIAQSGGFSVTAAYPTLAPWAPTPPGCAPTATSTSTPARTSPTTASLAVVALQNTVDQNGDAVTNGRAPGADANPEFSGEISAAMCQPGVVNCAPPGTGNTNHLVVSPRNSDGSVTTDGTRKRFYVVVTGDSTDRG